MRFDLEYFDRGEQAWVKITWRHCDISKIENGNGNPSLKTIERIASGMGMKVKVEFVPVRQAHAGSNTSIAIRHRK